MAAFTFAPSSRTADHLVGRESEIALLQELLERIPDRGGSLCIEGHAGLGKTSLLRWAAQRAATRGIQVLWAEGTESEREIAYSTVGQLVAPVFDLTKRLAADMRAALEFAAGLGSGADVGAPRVGQALVELFRQFREPLLIVVDDTQWLDPASEQVLVATLVGEPLSGLGVLTARRPDPARRAAARGGPVHRLAPLDRTLGRALVRRAYPAVPDSALTTIVALAGGNPLALVELPAALSEAQLRSPVLALDAVELGPRMRHLQAEQLDALPAPARQQLLAAALAGDPPIEFPGLDAAVWEGLVALHDAGLIRLDRSRGSVRFRDPLVRSMVIGLSTGAARRAAHEALVSVLDPGDERYPWHLAASVIGPDEQVATVLERTGERSLARGQADAAVRTYLLAAELSPSLERKARRLARAAYLGAYVVGDLHEASRLLDQARRTEPDTLRTMPAVTAAAYLLMSRDGDVSAAERLLTPAIASAAKAADEHSMAVAEALHHLLDLCVYACDEHLWDTFHGVVDGMSLTRFPDLQLRIHTMADPVRTAARELPRLEAALQRLEHEHDATVIGRLATAAFYVDRVEQARRPLLRLVRQTRVGGAAGARILALSLLATECIKTGHWAEAEAMAVEGMQLCQQRGYRLYTAPFEFCLAMLAATRGDHGETNRACTELLSWALPRGVRLAQVYAAHARTVLALGDADFDGAYRHATSVCRPGTFAPHLGWAIWMAFDVVEAAALSGHREQAAAHVEAMRRYDVGALSSRSALALAGAAAIAAPTLERQLFERALNGPDAARWPFELARVELRYGQALRRARNAGEARTHLERALATFETLPAPAWAEQTRAELRATSPPKSSAGTSLTALLTPQEQVVAQLAASGLTNKSIAGRLQISSRTVGAHLRSVFAKLAIRTRAALPDALAQLDGVALVWEGGSDPRESTHRVTREEHS